MIRSGQKGAFMKTRFLAGPFAAAALLLCVSAAESGVLVPIPPVPGSAATYVSDINNSNVIAGSYTTADGMSHGFFGTLDGNYSTFEVPDGTGGASALDDNNNMIGGTDPSPTCPYGGCGWRRNLDGKIRLLSKDREPIDGILGDLSGKMFVGDYRYLDQNGYFNVVPYMGKGTKYLADISLPFNTIQVRARGFHRSDFVEGWFVDNDDGRKERGFVMKDGVASAYDYPDDQAFHVQFGRMNNKGWIAGTWYDGEQTFSKAFLFNWKKERFLPIDLSGTYGYASAINDGGLAIVGADNVSSLYCPKKKDCPIQSAKTIVVPDKWIPARNVETRICRNGCLTPHRATDALKREDAVASLTAIARDQELRRELRLPFRP
jgi:hypothetical protein